MRSRSWFVFAAVVAALIALAAPRPALAAFHFMEIEQVIGGVASDASAQAVQLRMRLGGQNVLAGNARLRVHDAAGLNPIVLSTFPAPDPTNAAACARILLATAGFAAKSVPSVGVAERDYLMTAIPAGYLAAGSLTFEDVFGTIYWRVSWGGANYTGSLLINPTNGNATTLPPFAGPLPSATTQALQFTPACGTASTSTAAQYAVTAGAAIFTNNDPASYTVTSPAGVPALPEAARLILFIALGIVGASIAIARRRLA